ncbi:MraY family glycosyltransferase [Pseudomonas typographi]|uniref:MraY family glycosyltransferase n=1 Tax=Pseudomonas typographi TaxID=2715964 RepID=UPI001682BA0C|nr:glycosyltransferase family 4 protein [Pseudomonas typographi]MBD1555170.1 glycosyltransferase family 4 protein [Pseudomonas typographi]
MNYSSSLLAFFISVVGVWLVKKYASATMMLDTPNERSSHSVPTPRGGGVAVVLAFVCGIAIATYGGKIELHNAIILSAASLLVALVGFFDDRRGVSISVRLGCHVIAAGILLASADIPRHITFMDHTIEIGMVGLPIAALFVIWSLNLYNFMDGIDGIAACQAITVGLSMVTIGIMGGDQNLVQVFTILGASCAGFLLWNYPPAKIFLGDVGSGFIGFVMAATVIIADKKYFLPFLIFMAIFILDASCTLLCRVWTGHAPVVAHREHIYQRAARNFGAHGPVVIYIFLFNIIVLFPLGTYAFVRPSYSGFILVGTYAWLLSFFVWGRRRWA